MADIDELIREGPLDEDDLIELMKVGDNEKDGNGDFIGEIQLLMADLTREGLKFATSMEQHFLRHDPDMERALEFQRDLKFCVAGYQKLYKQTAKPKQQLITDFIVTEKPTEAVNNS